MPPRKDLGSILVDEDVLAAKDLERVAGATRRPQHPPLWAALIENELATADQIFRALSARFGVPVITDEKMAEVKLPDALKPALTRAEALLAGLLPIDLSADGQRATVAMVDPSDEKTLADFLTRAQVPEGRALLARRDALVRAIERVFFVPGVETTAVVTPLPPQQRRRAPSKSQPMQTITPPPGDDDVTGTVKLDPTLQAEIQRLPARLQTAEPLTPLPQKRPKRPTPPATPPPATAATAEAESPSEALRAEERLTRALVETIEALATELEARIVGVDASVGSGVEMARLARRVARQLGLPRRACDEIGVAAQLFALDRAMRAVEGASAPDVFGDLGWVASGEGGLMPILRALTAASSGFGRGAPGASSPATSMGARIISIVADYQELGAAATAVPDLQTVSQLLRASPAGAPVVDALLRVLEIERGDKTPPTPTMLAATSVLKQDLVDDEEPTPPPVDPDKTARKPYPRKEGNKGE